MLTITSFFRNLWIQSTYNASRLVARMTAYANVICWSIDCLKLVRWRLMRSVFATRRRVNGAWACSTKSVEPGYKRCIVFEAVDAIHKKTKENNLNENRIPNAYELDMMCRVILVPWVPFMKFIRTIIVDGHTKCG